MRKLVLLGALAASSTTSLAAGVTSAPLLTLEGAKSVAASALSYAQANAAPGAAVAIVDSAGTLLYLERLDGTFLNASEIAVGKARTAALFGKPTRAFEELVNKGRIAMLGIAPSAPFTPLQGGAPITISGRIVGAIGVSGAASAAQDEEIANTGAQQFEKAQQPRVSFVPSAAVQAGFRADAALAAGPGYRVNASHRDGPGEAEVHLEDTDIFYVLEGAATFVTGGELAEPRRISAAEMRGAAVIGGEERRLAPGDVITIPRGVPHWFKRVEAPLRYYVVKSGS